MKHTTRYPPVSTSAVSTAGLTSTTPVYSRIQCSNMTAPFIQQCSTAPADSPEQHCACACNQQLVCVTRLKLRRNTQVRKLRNWKQRLKLLRLKRLSSSMAHIAATLTPYHCITATLTLTPYHCITATLTLTLTPYH